MRELRYRRKVKDIAEGRRDSEGGVIKEKQDGFKHLESDRKEMRIISLTCLFLSITHARWYVKKKRKQ